jgi:hypothetical protein
MKHLISLVSHQTVPNVLFINEAKDVDNYVFIYTDRMEKELHQITDAVHLPTNMLTLICVDAYSVDDIKEKLNALKFKETDEYVVNLTGGTKLMFLGAYQFFEKFKHTKMVYLGIGGNSYQSIYPTFQPSTPLSYLMNIEEYIACHDFKMKGKKNKLVRTEMYTKTILLAQTHNQLPKAWHDFMRNLRDRKWNNTRSIDPDKVRPKGREFLVKMGFLTPKTKTINQAERHYLIGGWLEEYAYAVVKEKLGLSDDHLAHSVEIIEGEALNEMDVFFIHNNTPYAIECKTGIAGKLFSPTIYKQSSFRDKIGKDLRLVLFSLSIHSDKETGEIKTRQADRASQHEITVIDRNGLLNNALDDYLEKLISI